MREELHIPDAAVDACYDLLSVDRGHYVPDVIRTISTPVVAAELRAQADQFEGRINPATLLPNPFTLTAVVAQLRARADELDPPGGAPVSPAAAGSDSQLEVQEDMHDATYAAFGTCCDDQDDSPCALIADQLWERGYRRPANSTGGAR